MSQILFIVIITILANLVISFLIFHNNPKSATNKLLSFLALITVFWTIFNYIAQLPASEEIRLFWVRLVMFATTPYGTIIILLSKAYPSSKLEVNSKFKWGLIIFNIWVAGLAISPYMFTGVENLSNGSFKLQPGWGMAFYTIGFMGFMGIGFIQLIRKFFKSKGIQRQQLSYFLWGMILSFTLLTLTNFIAVNVFNTTKLTALGPSFTLIMFVFTGYAIIKHKFLDINYLASRSLSYASLLIFFMGGYVISLFTLTKILPESIDRTILSMLLTLIAAYSFNPLKNSFERITENIFFKGHYSTEKLLSKLTQIMATELKVETLSNKLLTMLTQEMRLTRGAFILTDNNQIQNIEQLNFSEGSLDNDELIQFLKGKQNSYIFEELNDELLKNLFRKLKISVILPLKVKNTFIGLLILGQKSSGDIYSNQDLELLEILAPQAAIALQNAESYRKIKRFNRTLERKVEERTEELRKTQDKALLKAKQLLKIKDEFVFIATHDLGTPVTAIKGFTYLLEKDKNLSEYAKENISALKESSERLSKLTNDLLQIARSESGMVKIKTTNIDIISLIKSILKEVSPYANKLHIKLDGKFHAKKCMVMADEKKLSEVMENLLSNAIKYNKNKGSVIVTTKIVKDRLQVDVADTGLGIPEKSFSKVFQKFSRLNQPGTENTPGTGLGLFVVRMMVEKMKGKISFTSIEGKGTTFSFVLPLASKKLISKSLDS